MKLYKKVESLLEREPRARERVNRARAIWNILLELDPRLRGEELMTKEMFIDNWSTIQSLNRLICKVEEDNELLRGMDYKDKDRLEEEKMIELGYQPGHKFYSKELNKTIKDENK